MAASTPTPLYVVELDKKIYELACQFMDYLGGKGTEDWYTCRALAFELLKRRGEVHS